MGSSVLTSHGLRWEAVAGSNIIAVARCKPNSEKQQLGQSTDFAENTWHTHATRRQCQCLLVLQATTRRLPGSTCCNGSIAWHPLQLPRLPSDFAIRNVQAPMGIPLLLPPPLAANGLPGPKQPPDSQAISPVVQLQSHKSHPRSCY